MARLLTSVLGFLFAVTLCSGIASAKTCRDAKGKFIKCPTAVVTPAPKRCRDAKGKFTKCKTMVPATKG